MRRRIYEMIEKGEQEDKISLYYDRFIIFCIIASVLPLCVKNSTNPVFYRIDRITVFIFIIDYLLRWGTADFKLKGEKPFLRYPFTFFAVVDLIAILSSLTPLYSTLKAVRILRLPKCMKPLKILRYSKGFHLMMQVIHKEKDNLFTIGLLAVGYIFLSALILFQVEPDTFATVGYGDICPATSIGKIIAIVTSFVGIAVFALPTGIITAGYLAELKPKHKR